VQIEDLAIAPGGDIIPDGEGPRAPGESKSGTNTRKDPAAGKQGGRNKSSGRQSEKLTQTEVEYWLQEFGEIAQAADTTAGNGMSLKELEDWYEELKRQERKSGR
jgi:hypothetical protein